MKLKLVANDIKNIKPMVSDQNSVIKFQKIKL